MKTKAIRLATLILLNLGAIFCFEGQAEACGCADGGGPVCQEYWNASAVFVGTVIDSKLVPVKEGEFEYEQWLVRLSLDEAFRGVEGAQVEVVTGLNSAACGFGFQARQYLVYAHESGGKLTTSICSRTKEISSAAGDLKYMRGLKNSSRSGGSIFGEVFFQQLNEGGGRDQQAVRGATISIRGTASREMKTDDKGQYRVNELAPGEYTVKVVPPQGMTTRESESKINLSPGGCAAVSFSLENDGRMNGRVLSPQGLPVNKAEIVLHEFDKERYRGYADYAYSDEDGKYSFKMIPPGRYVLAIRFDGMTSQNRPFPIIYYPGVSDRSQATVITIAKGWAIADYNLELPPLPPEHEVTVSVVWSNGQPAVGARVSYLMANDSVSYAANKNGSSNFSFMAYEGLRLTLNAAIESEKEKAIYSEWVEVTVSAGNPAVKLVLPLPK